MRRIMIPTLTQPDDPNVNNVVYTRDVWNKYICSMRETHCSSVPVTIEQNPEWCKIGIPTNKIIGCTSVISDKYIIVDLLEDKYKNDKLAAAVINKTVNMINEGEVKAYMNYMADIDHEPNMAHIYIEKIHKIIYFHLGRSNPRDHRPIELKIAKGE